MPKIQSKRKIFMDFKRKIFMDLKKADKAMNPNPLSTLDVLEIKRISSNGIFEVGDGLYSKSYFLEDLNYVTLSYEEQLRCLFEWCKVILSFDTCVKVTVFNKNRSMDYLRRKILYHKKFDGFDDSRNAYNDIIEGKILGGKKGIEQVKYVTVTVKRNNYEEAKSYLASVENSLNKEFVNIGSALIPLSGNERLRVLYNFYRIGEEDIFNVNISKFMESGFSDWKNDIAPSYSDFNTKNDSFRTDKGICRAYCIDPESYPNSLSDNFFNELSNITTSSIFTIDYINIPKDVVTKTLESKLGGVEGKIVKQQQKRNRQKDFSSDISYSVRMEKKDIEKMLDDVNDNDQGMLWCGVTIVLIAEDEKNLKTAEMGITQIVEGKGCKLKTYVNWQREALNTALPIGVHQVDYYRAMFTQDAAILMPFSVVEIKPKKDPFYYGINQINKNPILANRKYDIFNGNGFVFGVPGSGKSFTGAKMEMGSIYLKTEDHIIVVDPTLEYFDVADAFGGEKINFATYTTQYHNPLEVELEKLSKLDENGIIKEKCNFMVCLCQQAMELDFKPSHKSVVSRCTQRVYEKIADMPVEERYNPILSDINDELKKQDEKEAKEIMLAMEIFIDGALNIYNHQTNVDIKNRIIVFGMRDLGESLYAISMLVMLEYITGRIMKNAAMGIATWLYVDEFHVLCDKTYTKQYFISTWKKIRKLGGLCTGITQNISDLLKDKDTASLISNSEYTMFLKQSAVDADLILKNCPYISSAQLDYVFNATPGTGLIRFNNIVQPLDNQIEKDNPIYDVFNTNLHEKIAKLKEKEGVIEDIEIA